MSEILSKQRKISISELPEEIPDFSSAYEPKDSIIKKWITNWILSAISKKKIKENDIMPNKTELSKHLGVSIGTVQNAIRYVEDEGYLKSKQRLGTMISNCSNPIENNLKSTTKRERTIIEIKKVLIKQRLTKNSPVPSTRKMSEIIGISQNTVRLSYEYLCSIGILESKKIRSNDSCWYLKQIPSLSKEEAIILNNKESNTLVDKIAQQLRNYLSTNCKIGDKIPTHEELSSKLGVSIKTIHDAVELLVNDGIVIARRGRYGCILAQDPLNPEKDSNIADTMFSSAQEASIYSYQKIESQITSLIIEKFNPGDKLPSLLQLAQTFDVSTNTIRKALKNLEYDGFITFGRGRYGGIFVVDKPDYEEKTQYQWLSINPEMYN